MSQHLNVDPLEELSKQLENDHLGPLWETLGEMVTKEPTHSMKPYLWKWQTIRQHLLKSGELLTVGRKAERRVVYLQNPSLKDKVGFATETLYAGIQLLLPGEVAPSHRHSQGAIRFVIEGDGAFTTVNGEKTYMEEGDLVLTPAWTWHDHGHEGTEPMIWMDGLDVGMVKNLCGSFFELFDEETYPVKGIPDGTISRFAGVGVRPIADRKGKDGYPSPLINYKWDNVKKALEELSQLEPDPFDGYAVDYINPTNGQSADARIGCTMQMLSPGMHTQGHRHVHSVIYHVKKGSGYTVINGEKYEWSTGDFFVIPPWHWHEHGNTGEEEAFLFSINDRPVMEMVGLEMEEVYEKNNGFQEVERIFQP
ncbi:cupin domain-containing protein [Halalkalibacterium halodurans]|uniref:Gentisate 1,2-dioxygenase n=1 Tax=Halalkalibacterium halodurans (strain ATCC BAA-125 / DSM 18197 / FERM 7344 / JCM 9153 / C-125) TaxID=272558 RepID=Q9KBC4_HALH5|nr:cupin domain-containing protein [Halalkalibacterium halodurans]MDY7222563.1 cupin domain-containing protein [Halalkalibacterium halodurans]MDY7241784.1 cupin domain-containing protein [Halalkalibacterium halodurans]MED4123962.1 cupin domain-containing protein [Halalkalibacterium halodurans]BAB05723.1 gentisate 1,2-dioxygenase [Halalkalibacterium halodurans C-125]